jgi:hypothetical protein
MTRRSAVVFGVIDLITAALVVLGVFVGLPDRWWPVDAGSAGIAVLMVAAGGGLIAGAPWASSAARAASGVALAVGLSTVALLALAASYLRGIYGPVGSGGAVIMVLVAGLVLPYMVALPAVQLVWLGRGGRQGREEASGA